MEQGFSAYLSALSLQEIFSDYCLGLISIYVDLLLDSDLGALCRA